MQDLKQIGRPDEVEDVITLLSARNNGRRTLVDENGMVYKMASVRGKTALVTGASRGIGCATASALAEAGAHVMVHYSRSA